MSASTASDSDTNEDLIVQSAGGSICIKNLPTCVAWRDSHGENCYLSDVTLSLVYDDDANRALVRLQATIRLKKGLAKRIYLFVKPDQIRSLAYISTENELDHDKEFHGFAQEKLKTSTHMLKFELRNPPTLVAPTEYRYEFLRASSQATWTSCMAFAKDANCFFLHIPTKSLSKTQLVSFCQAASNRGALTPLDENIASIYGGRGGKVVDPHSNIDDDVDDATEARPSIGASSIKNDAPPTYDRHTAGGPSVSHIVPPPYLAPTPDLPKLHKRRREESDGSISEGSVPYKRVNTTDEMILRAILNLQKTVYEARAEHGASISKITAKIEEIEGRFGKFEESQRELADEVRTCMASPLWEELDERLRSQEDRDFLHMRDIVEEVVDESIEAKMAEGVDEYLRNDDEGQGLLREVVGKMIYEETRDILQSQSYTGSFTVSREPSQI
ncbi:hypothetical protein EKO27_g4379 [Xylaria grammica]|uniref:Uncharacterized protein n=1 Tax=Xylaria grammica TaxID=363999 RepID=A0A439D8J0_9PEZI|nr:hypothetical protein EKO27_g4379 [Xylaria grammica]